MVGAIVLAAGRSRRMGTQKLLLPWAGQTVIGHVVDQILAAGVDRVWVVVSGDREAISKALADRPVSLVTNPNPDSEMLSSVRCGVRALPDDCKSALIVLGDQPGLSSQLIANLLTTFKKSGRGIAAPSHRGHRGHPLVITSRYFPELLTQFGGEGLHGLLAGHAEDIQLLEIDAAGLLVDLDYPEDYERALAEQSQKR